MIPLSMGFPRQEYWSELPFPPPGDLPYPGLEPISFASLALAGRVFLPLCHLGSPEFSSFLATLKSQMCDTLPCGTNSIVTLGGCMYFLRTSSSTSCAALQRPRISAKSRRLDR